MPVINEYEQLKRLVTQKGLLNKYPRAYTCKLLVVWTLLGLGLILLALTRNLFVIMLDAAFLAVVSGQIGFIGHDAGHQQIFKAGWKNQITSFIHGNLLLGISSAWWIRSHNLHHKWPNRVNLDPAVDFPVLAFSEEQARAKQGLRRFMVNYQAYIFFPLLCLTLVGIRIDSIKFLLQKKAKHPLIEALLLTAHFTLYFGLLFFCLGLPRMLLFAVIHQALFGLYMGSTFAPNHKGMPVLGSEDTKDFLRCQVLTARNVSGHRLLDLWYGGLNHQIEHHLFPSMPRNRLREAQKIVKEFCHAHSIPYYEAGFFQSYREILKHLYGVSASSREESSCEHGFSNSEEEFDESIRSSRGPEIFETHR
ncbi:MAG: fatty acid desaturase family protein [Terriglobia bacterium]